ncbi:nucleotide-binding protein [Aliivibrio fischeri]|uniref:TIR domain-containing protein n=1 Tax=Aliivibrio fischeri TaxID=668 RepID=UPI00107EAB2E|nr:TIR domain-containing protein [Aliivibrio fischeri]TGA68183.1 nucleotide-binding protein [Aliivibrio fischeri]
MSKYYHVILETNELDSKGKRNSEYWFDCQDINELDEDVIDPYVRKTELYISGRQINFDNVHSLIVKVSSQPISYLVDAARNRVPSGVFYVPIAPGVVRGSQGLEDVTKDLVKQKRSEVKAMRTVITEVEQQKNTSESLKKVFIVHGHDDLAKTQMARFIENADLEPIILHEKVSSGMTIIEKIESYSDVGFAVILYTPCDFGGSNQTDATPQARARQNVVFEHGYFLGRLGRSKVSAFVKSDIETPNDISGVVYTTLDDAGAWKMSLVKELKAAGYTVNLESLF